MPTCRVCKSTDVRWKNIPRNGETRWVLLNAIKQADLRHVCNPNEGSSVLSPPTSYLEALYTHLCTVRPGTQSLLSRLVAELYAAVNDDTYCAIRRFYGEGDPHASIDDALYHPARAFILEIMNLRPLMREEQGDTGGCDFHCVFRRLVAYIMTVELDLHMREHLSFPSTSQPEDSTMNIDIQTVTFVNGTDANKLTDDELFDTISAAEAEIHKLESIQNRPLKISDRIIKLRDGIAALVALSDSSAKLG